jgi:hypothetical protein
MNVLVLINVLLMIHAILNCKSCEVWNSLPFLLFFLFFLLTCIPSHTIPTDGIVWMLNSSLALSAQDCRTLMVDAQQIGNASQALGTQVCLFFHLFISHVVAMNFRVQQQSVRNVTFLYFSKWSLNDAKLLPADLAGIQCLWRAPLSPCPRLYITKALGFSSVLESQGDTLIMS